MDVPGRPSGSEGVNVPPAVLVVVGYILGSISFAVLLVRARTGSDIRAEGSGNAGATNVLRAHGKKLALAVALLDVAKGAAAVLLVRLVTGDPRWAAAAGFAAILGHVFPLFYGFRGGKGVATAVGAFLALAPPAIHLARSGHGVLLWSRDSEVAAAITREHRHPRRLPGIPIPEQVRTTSDLGEAFEHSETLLLSVPCAAMREVLDASPGPDHRARR